jgi:vitamin B12 transporter
MSKKVLIAASAVALAVSSAFAQSETTGATSSLYQLATLDPVVVTAARYEQPLSRVLTSTSVITREQIERSQAPTLVDLLQGEAGVEIARNGGPGTLASIFLRGQNSTNLAIFIDGVRVQADNIGFIRLVDIPIDQIERIEILRGNAGALYGEAAVGGVINIFTRSGTGKPGGYGSVSYGSRNTSDVSVGYSGGTGKSRFHMSAQRYDTDGFSAMNNLQSDLVNPENDAYRRESVYLRFDQDVREDLSLGFSAKSIYSDVYFDRDSPFYGDKPTDVHLGKNRDTDYTFFVDYRPLQSWVSKLALTSSKFKYREFVNGEQQSLGDGGFLEGNQNSLRWSNIVDRGVGKIVFGIDAVMSDFSSYGEKYDRESSGAYIGYGGNYSQLDYQVNLRRDNLEARSTDSRVKNDATTWLLGLGYQLTESLRATSSLSTGFRAPGPAEMLGPFSANPNLRPEEHRGAEAGLLYKTGRSSVRLVWFKTSTTNAIVWGGSKPENIGRAENKGVEVQVSTFLSGMQLKATLVSQDPINSETLDRLQKRAREYGSLSLLGNYFGYEIGLDTIVSGNRVDRGNTLGGYTFFNIHVSRRLNNDLVARLKVENASDKDYQLAWGYNTPPRGVFLSVQYAPK